MNRNVGSTWSEPVLLRRKAAAKTGRNYESQFEIVARDEELLVRQEVGEEVERKPTDADENCAGFSFSCDTDCKCRVFAKKRDSNVATTAFSKSVDKQCKSSAEENEQLENFKQQLDIRISKYQVEEALASDLHDELVLRYERLGNLLGALLQYVECVLLELKASYRLCHQLNGLLTNDNSLVITESLSQLVKKLSCDSTFGDQCQLLISLNGALENSPNLSDMEEDYLKKKHDFVTAIENFKIILQNDCMNFVQLEKLANQLDAILFTYQQSRNLFDQEMPNLINVRVKLFTGCLDKLSNDMLFVGTQNREISALFKQLQISMGGCNNLVSTDTPKEEFLVGKNEDLINLLQN